MIGIQNLLKLKQGSIDATLDDERVLTDQVNQFMPNSMSGFEFIATPLIVSGIHIGVSRQNPEHEKMVADFERTIEAMRKDGSYDRLLEGHRSYIEQPVSRSGWVAFLEFGFR